MNKILISACLLGNPVRYDGESKALHHASIDELVATGRVVSFCPEVAGGLPVPRAAAEIDLGDGTDVIAGRARVKTRDGADVTDYFLDGAQQALDRCREHGIEVAVLTESSPSCGSGRIYDGSFRRNAIAGAGVTSALLRRHGIRVFNQQQIDEALEYLESGRSRDKTG